MTENLVQRMRDHGASHSDSKDLLNAGADEIERLEAKFTKVVDDDVDETERRISVATNAVCWALWGTGEGPITVSDARLASARCVAERVVSHLDGYAARAAIAERGDPQGDERELAEMQRLIEDNECLRDDNKALRAALRDVIRATRAALDEEGAK